MRIFVRKINTLISILFPIIKLFFIKKFFKIDILIVGPWKGELGYELLYWIPFIEKFIFNKKIEKIIFIIRKPLKYYYCKILPKKNIQKYKFIFISDFISSKQIEDKNDLKILKIILKKIKIQNKIFILHPKYFYNFLRLNLVGILSNKALINKLNLDFFKKTNNKIKKNSVSIWVYKNDYLKKKSIRINKNKFMLKKYKKINIIFSKEFSQNHLDFNHKSLGLPYSKKIKYYNYSKRNFSKKFDKISKLIEDSKLFISTWGGSSYIGYYLGTNTIRLYDRKPSVHERHRLLEKKIEKKINDNTFISYKV